MDIHMPGVYIAFAALGAALDLSPNETQEVWDRVQNKPLPTSVGAVIPTIIDVVDAVRAERR